MLILEHCIASASLVMAVLITQVSPNFSTVKPMPFTLTIILQSQSIILPLIKISTCNSEYPKPCCGGYKMIIFPVCSLVHSHPSVGKTSSFPSFILSMWIWISGFQMVHNPSLSFIHSVPKFFHFRLLSLSTLTFIFFSLPSSLFFPFCFLDHLFTLCNSKNNILGWDVVGYLTVL